MRHRLLAPALALASIAALPVIAAQAASNGPLALVRGTTLSLQPAAGGAPTVRLTGVQQGSPLAASKDGTRLAFLTGPVGDSSHLSITKVAGGAVKTVTLKGLAVNSLAFSPDGRALVLTAFPAGDNTPGHVRVYLYRTATAHVTLVRTAVRWADDAVFTPDGRSILYVGDRLQEQDVSDCASALRRVRVDGTHDTLVYQGSGGDRPCPVDISLSPGGTSVAMTAIIAGDEPAGPGPPAGVWRLALAKGSKPKLLASTAATPAWSPAGDRIAYGAFGRTDQYPYTGVTGLFTQPKGGGAPAPLSTEGVGALVWLAG